MPYSSNDELPEAVKSGLSAHQQEIWKAAFNNARQSGVSEESCFRIAWAAAKRGGGSDDKDD